MAVTLRLVRMGRRNRSFFRLRVSDSRFAAGGRFLEEVGIVDPITKDAKKQVVLDGDRIKFWLERGATTSDTVRSLLKKNGIKVEKRGPAAAAAK
jgi:small subunit ribosomal protein S16